MFYNSSLVVVLGLGTSSTNDGKRYFQQIANNRVMFGNDSDNLLEFFDAKQADARKQWLASNNRPLDSNSTEISYADFKNRQLFDFAIDSNQRAIIDIQDGLKPSQRKILFTLFDKYKSDTKKELKIFQLGSSVAEHTAYMHGEVSLQEAIFKMCQDFAGANNVTLIQGEGQYGSLNSSNGVGSDHASARYVFCKLHPIARAIFKPIDDNILVQKTEEGVKVEYESFISVVPMCLVNGSVGIGLGYSTTIPSYNVSDIIANLKNKLTNNQDFVEMYPFFNGFRGTVEKVSDTSYDIIGVWCYKAPVLEITELPVGIAFIDYQAHLDTLVTKGLVKKFQNSSTTTHALFTIVLVSEYEIDNDVLIKTFKLKTSIATTNMHMFIGNRIKKYSSTMEILNTFYNLSMDRYTKRKEFMISSYSKKIEQLSLDHRLIGLVVNEEVIIFKRSRGDINSQLEEFNLGQHVSRLLAFNVGKFTSDELDKLGNAIQYTKTCLQNVKSTSQKQSWLDDLAELEKMMLP